MATSVSSQGTNDLPSNKEAGNSAKPTFLGKSVSIAKNVLLFVVGAVFFPVVSIAYAINDYKDLDFSELSKSAIFVSITKAFLLPIPILGGIVHISGQLLYRFNKNSIFADEDTSGCILSTIVITPFVGSGFITIMSLQ
jgi:hypothetical protein